MKRLYLLLGLVIILGGCCSSMQHREGFTATKTPIVEPTIAVTPPPEYLGLILPEPGSSYSVAEYETLAPTLGGWEATVPGICLGVRPFWLMEPGDFPTPDEWLARIHLIVDGGMITEYHSILMNDSFGSEGIDSETGEVLFKAPDGSPYGICYAATLGVGRHTVIFVAKKTSGEEATYTWQFRITE
jgi:hypothetical protein